MLSCFEIFCGAGGLATGLQQAGFSYVGAIDNNFEAIQTINGNNLFLAEQRDFREFVKDRKSIEKIHNIDLLCGGPPCQPFSIGGLKKREKDERNFFEEIVNLVREVKPRAFLFENASGLFTLQKDEIISYGDYIVERLKCPCASHTPFPDLQKETSLPQFMDPPKLLLDQQYEVQVWQLNSAQYGVPQTRRRAIIVGVRSDVKKPLCMPLAKFTSADLINAGNKKILQKWRTVTDAIGHLPVPNSVSHSSAITDHLLIKGAISYKSHTGSSLNKPSKAITAGTHGVGGGQNTVRSLTGFRYYTLHEMKLIQTFPKEYAFYGSRSSVIKQIGNAIPPLLAFNFGKSLKLCLA